MPILLSHHSKGSADKTDNKIIFKRYHGRVSLLGNRDINCARVLLDQNSTVQVQLCSRLIRTRGIRQSHRKHPSVRRVLI